MLAPLPQDLCLSARLLQVARTLALLVLREEGGRPQGSWRQGL